MSFRDKGTKLYVGNLSSSTTRGDLEYEFEYYGRLINVWVARNPPGFAYIDFEDSRDADDAIRGLDGREINGRRIRVERSHGNPRGRREESRFGLATRRPFHPTDRCYNCGESGHYAYDCDLYSRRKRLRRSASRSRSRTPRRRRRYSRSYSRSRSRSRRRSRTRSRSRSYSRSRSRSFSKERSKSYSKTPEKRKRSESDTQRNGNRSSSRSRSRSR